MEVIIKLLFMLFFILTGIKYVTNEYGGVRPIPKLHMIRDIIYIMSLI